jgi:hypothetical protein
MSGTTLLAKLLAATGISSPAVAAATAVASGAADISAEDLTTGTQSLEQLVAAAHAEGVNAGRKAERERFGAVLTAPEAAGRMGLAITQLSTTDNTPEQIIGCLKTVPTAAEAIAPPADPPAGQQAGQRAQADPLRQPAGDSISSETPLVDTGAPGGAAGAGDPPDEKQIDTLWTGAMASVSGGITTGGMPGAIGVGRPN